MSGRQEPSAGGRRASDPLVETESGRERIRRYLTVLALAAGLYAALVGAAVGAVRLAGVGGEGPGEDETVEVAIVEQEPPPEQEEPPPEPEEPPTPPPEPEERPQKDPPEPDEKPEDPPPDEPEPEEPSPEPKQKPPPDPKPEPSKEKPPVDEPKESQPESTKPVHLDGLEMESTVEGGEGPKMKVGKGIRHGKVTDKYVDPDRMGEIETGDGDGEGRGSSSTPGSGESTTSGRTCKDRPAKVVDRVRADSEEYPIEATRRGIEGEVVAMLTVDPNGKVVEVEIKKSLGHGLDQLAERAFRQWTFKPARKDCKSVRTTVRATHEFRLRR